MKSRFVGLASTMRRSEPSFLRTKKQKTLVAGARPEDETPPREVTDEPHVELAVVPQDGVPVRRDKTVAGLVRGDIIIRPQHALDVPQVMPALGVHHVVQIGRALGGVRQRHGPRSVGCQRRGISSISVDGATFEKRSNRFLEGARELLRISASNSLPDPLQGLLMNSGLALHRRSPLVRVGGAVP